MYKGLLGILIVILIVLYEWNSKKNLNRKVEFKLPDRYQYMSELPTDQPIDFGYKTTWIAIPAFNKDTVANDICLRKQETVDWVEGMVRAYEGEVFVTPELNGWILIHGFGISMSNRKASKLLDKLSKIYGKAFLFGSFRVSSTYYWMKSIQGNTERVYVADDGSGETIGTPDKLEESWNLIDFNHPDSDTEEYWETHEYPSEDEVIALAELWSINPLNISLIEGVEGTGIIGLL